jgi:type I restriction enzyme R subunit
MKFDEEALELAVIELFESIGYQYTHGNELHKELNQALLHDDLNQYLSSLYPELTQLERQLVINRIELLSSSALYESNKEFLRSLTEGMIFQREDKSQKDLVVYLVDRSLIENNIFRVVNQLEIKGYEKRIPDLIVYINGIPLVVWEFKSAIKEDTTIKNAYDQLTIRYRRDIPELLKYNAFCVLSDGSNTKMGSLFASYDNFYAWRKVEDSDEPSAGISSLHTMVHGLFDKNRLLDVICNFIFFPDTSHSELKVVCRYPQYYAARKLFNSIRRQLKPQGSGKGGTYFGATGSGKSLTMVFLVRLLMKSIEMNNPTLVLITDRTDLDDQLADLFLNAKQFIGDENVVKVSDRNNLKERLGGIASGGVYLTTIQKFSEDTDLLSVRNNIVCISDEAHRTQINIDQKVKISNDGVSVSYGFAKYLHDSLPNATYVGVTGTPIDGTLAVFGEVADFYTMRESVEDGITVRIIYEGRAARVLLDAKKLEEIEKYYEVAANEGATSHQIQQSKNATTKIEVILGDPERIKSLAKDFVEHYELRLAEGSSVYGKVMFVCSSRPTAYEFFKAVIKLRPDWNTPSTGDTTYTQKRNSKPIEKIRMVMTRDKDDEPELYSLLGSKEDRKELDRIFKDQESNFKIAVVVDMWLTGFDVPFLETIYIDKPIQQHSLIQTISRVNRIYASKQFGLVVDYIGIKANMNKALAMYSKVHKSDFEVTEKSMVVVIDQLDLLGRIFHEFDSSKYFNGSPLERLNCLNSAVEYVQRTQDIENRFLAIMKVLKSAYDLCCTSEQLTEDQRNVIHFFMAVRTIILKITVGTAPDVEQMNQKVKQLIEDALISEGVEELFKSSDKELGIDVFGTEYVNRINKIKFPNTKIKMLERLLRKAIAEYKKTNKIKAVDFSDKLKKLVDAYNERRDFEVIQSDVLEDIATQFASLFHELNEEKNSFEALGIDFEEKAFYDILKSVAIKYKFEYPEDKLILLSQSIKSIVDDKSKYTDWSKKADIKAELKVDLILILDEHGYPPVTQDEVFQEILEQAENFKRYIAL